MQHFTQVSLDGGTFLFEGIFFERSKMTVNKGMHLILVPRRSKHRSTKLITVDTDKIVAFQSAE